MNTIWDCVVVGGGAAGLSAALVLGRARRRTLVVDAGRQSNRPAHGIGGLLGHDGRPPAELYAIGREELSSYPSVELLDGDVEHGERDGEGFTLRLAGGRREHARRVLLATGMEYRPPELPGLAELWGATVFHCPFCHGWELRDQPLAVLDRGDTGPHRALLLRGWSDDVVLLTDGPAELGAADLERLSAAGVPVDERRVARLVARDGELSAIELADGATLERRGLLVPSPLHQRSPLAHQLGARSADPGPVAVDSVAVDAQHRTSVPGVFAAGDVSAPFPQVAAAIAAGSMAAAMIVQSLVAEDFGLPLPAGGHGAVVDKVNVSVLE
jgi:thioredoxin reductase